MFPFLVSMWPVAEKSFLFNVYVPTKEQIKIKIKKCLIPYYLYFHNNLKYLYQLWASIRDIEFLTTIFP